MSVVRFDILCVYIRWYCFYLSLAYTIIFYFSFFFVFFFLFRCLFSWLPIYWVWESSMFSFLTSFRSLSLFRSHLLFLISGLWLWFFSIRIFDALCIAFSLLKRFVSNCTCWIWRRFDESTMRTILNTTEQRILIYV